MRTRKIEVVLTNLEMTAKKEDKEVKREESVVRQARGHVGVPIPTLAAHNPDTGSVSLASAAWKRWDKRQRTLVWGGATPYVKLGLCR